MDILKPKSQEELNTAFKQYAKMSWDKFIYYLNELSKMGVTIKNKWDWRTSSTTIALYKIYSNNWHVISTVTEKDALSLLQALKQYAYETGNYKIVKDDHSYLNPHQIRDLFKKLKYNIQYSQKYSSDQYINVSNKYDDPNYDDWYTKNRDELRSIRSKEQPIDESILKPKSENEIKKQWPIDTVSYDEFIEIEKQLKKLGVKIKSLKIGSFGPYYEVDGFYVFLNDHGIIRTLTKKQIHPEQIYLYYAEAKHYVNTKIKMNESNT